MGKNLELKKRKLKKVKSRGKEKNNKNGTKMRSGPLPKSAHLGHHSSGVLEKKKRKARMSRSVKE